MARNKVPHVKVARNTEHFGQAQRRILMFSLIRSDFNVLSWKVIALKNFNQYNPCQGVRGFRLKFILMKAFITIITKHVVCHCVRFSELIASKLSKLEQHLLSSFLVEMIFSMTANVQCTVKQCCQTFCETHVAHRLALIHSTRSSSPSSEH